MFGAYYELVRGRFETDSVLTDPGSIMGYFWVVIMVHGCSLFKRTVQSADNITKLLKALISHSPFST